MIWLLLLLPQLANAGISELARSQRWLRLLHYKEHIFTGTRSTLDSAGFFFSPDGRRDPEKELKATLQAFLSNISVSKLPQPPSCAFPARFRFLNEELSLGLAQPRCALWEEFLGRFRERESVVLVFSSAYPNNPSSMFGHTFLRIQAGGAELLDMGLSYAARVPESDGDFAFVTKGLSGGYEGSFSAVPYYAKVGEYNNSESRDLWEYELNLNKDEVWWLLANAWELEVNGKAPYYFFDENCSFEILTLLEVAKPGWTLRGSVFEIPGESVKKVMRIPDAVKSVKLRPSLFRRLVAFENRLDAADRAEFQLLIAGKGSAVASVAALDTAAKYFFYRKQKSGGLSRREAAAFDGVLLSRATKREPSPPEPHYDESSRPDLGHNAGRISLGMGKDGGGFAEFGIKFAYHDLLNHDAGYVPFSELDFPSLSVRWYASDKRFTVERAELLGITSLAPSTGAGSPLSWRVNVAYESSLDLCRFCHVLHAEGDLGFSEPFLQDQLRAYQLAGIFSDAGSALARRWRVGPRLAAGLLANVTSRWKQQLEVGGFYDPFSVKTLFATAQWGQSYFFSPAWETRLEARGAWANAQSRAELALRGLYYF